MATIGQMLSKKVNIGLNSMNYDFADKSAQDFLQSIPEKPKQEITPAPSFAPTPTPVTSVAIPSNISLFSDEKEMWEKMKKDWVPDADAIKMIEERQNDIAKKYNMPKVSTEERQMYAKMRDDWVPFEDAVKMVANKQSDEFQKAQAEQKPMFGDQHADEGIIEQTIKAPFRAIGDTVMGAVNASKQTYNALDTLTSRAANDISGAIGGRYNPSLNEDIRRKTGSSGYVGDVVWATAWATGVAANLAAPGAMLGWNLASETPGAQYVPQAINTAIDKGSEELSNITGIDKGTIQNTLMTLMNAKMAKEGMKSGGSVPDIYNKASAQPTLVSGLRTAGTELAKTGLQTAVETVKMPYNIAKSTADIVGKGLSAAWVKSPFSQQGVTAKTEAGTEFTIDQTPTVGKNITDTIFKKTNEQLAQQSIFPKATKEKTMNARLEAPKIALEWVKQLYEDKAQWNIQSDIRTMAGWVDWVQEALDFHGQKIGELTKWEAVVNLTKEVKQLSKNLEAPLAWLGAWAKTMGENIVNEFNKIKDEGWNITPNIEEVQWALSNIKSEIFANRENISKLYKSKTGKALNDFLNSVEKKFNDTIESVSWNSLELKAEKWAYSRLKKIQKDFANSLVDSRSQGKWLTGTVGKIAGIMEILRDPTLSGIIKGVLLKEISETMQYYKTRGGNWETLIRNLDRESVDRALKSNKEQNGNNSTGSNPMDTQQPIENAQK